MPREYDSQLMESVGVRRRRLRDAVLFGAGRGRQTLDEYVGKAFIGVAVGAVVCAGCVGWSYLDRELAKDKQQQQQQSPTPAVTVSETPSETPSFSPSESTSPKSSPKPKDKPSKTTRSPRQSGR